MRSQLGSVAVRVLGLVWISLALGCDTSIYVRAHVTGVGGEPIEGALASISEITRSQGAQAVPTNRAGCVTLEYVTGGFGPQTLMVSMPGHRTVEAKVPMSRPVFYEIRLVAASDGGTSGARPVAEADLPCPRGQARSSQHDG